MNHETLSGKTATPQAEQEPSQSNQKIAALNAVYDAVRRRVYENSEHSNHDINEATIILGDLIVCEACLSAGLPPEDLPLTERTGYDADKTLPENIDLAIAVYLPDYVEKLPGLGYNGSGLAVSYDEYNVPEEIPDAAWQALELGVADEPMAAAPLVDPLRALVLMHHYYNLVVAPIEYGNKGRPCYDWSLPDTLKTTGVIALVVQLCMQGQTVVHRCVQREYYDAMNHTRQEHGSIKWR
jgi:hypothetical protein